MPRFAYYERLTRSRQRTYDKSDAIRGVALPPGVNWAACVMPLRAALESSHRAATQQACQRLADELVQVLNVPPVMVAVLARRPSNSSGELHGLYEPEEDGAPAKISVWMRTAQRRQVVAFRTFLRTLIHEICHHLDYELFALDETFHTEGFYQRESSLMRQLAGEAPRNGRRSAAAGD
jgi:hypothetical protein